MTAIKAVILTFSLAISSLAFAEGGGDRAFERMERARETAMATGKSAPAAGAQEDIAQEKLKAEKQLHHC
ncbi:co-regulatory protein PtrA N-terminal domain-containing protein [Pseudomonas shahriarae]|jgi:uncharacterized protein YhfF|uniref:Uncharacterized protein n=1 Tax=Pseudomonas shahriarae TaxID=2745512 RepID=A0ABT5NK45_9PSED|nr:co-regulatory protein PtrA N-terminal domain-containing protein [Pseudomonas shahriarae]MDD0987833.1 hypothetical protein [Pseudomonas shahriarae]MDD1032494.1 hypothetical protein [Pseudomonas shahriarae]